MHVPHYIAVRLIHKFYCNIDFPLNEDIFCFLTFLFRCVAEAYVLMM